jgi:hypothetical protein
MSHTMMLELLTCQSDFESIRKRRGKKGLGNIPLRKELKKSFVVAVGDGYWSES